jgi:hypothetical protein
LMFPANCFLRSSVGDKFFGNWTSSLFSRISSVVSSSLHSLSQVHSILCVFVFVFLK